MNYIVYYIVSTGIAFYAGGKLMPKTVYKTKKVKVKDPSCKVLEGKINTLKSYNDALDYELANCKDTKEELNFRAQRAESSLEVCEERYGNKYEKVLHPEEVEEKEPQMEDEYEY